MVNVMVCDDSAFMRNMLKSFVTNASGTIVAEAGDGNEAIEKYKQVKPDILFMDIMMPNKTGLDALKEIITAFPEAKIVMCTSVGQEKVVMEAVDAGASDYIVKPFKQEDIQAVLDKYKQ